MDQATARPGELILGLDPGSLHTGYGLIRCVGETTTLAASGRISPAAELPLPDRLVIIHRALLDLIGQARPSACAVEDVFTWKNPRSALKLAQARGAAVLAVALSGVPIFEYPPTLVKNAVTGNGRAEKSQVAFMVGHIFNLAPEELSPDASDALAAALCHAGQRRLTGLSGSASAAARNRGGSWRKLSPKDLAALGYQVEKST
ncbi:MAG: crossover junction endodeoxyribonuclease RuvC [Deltaproteobacteria bacterium]|nr:crossover junction endodeoxyribonuclease RuvC [Deltaproteobacteria bacterium]